MDQVKGKGKSMENKPLNSVEQEVEKEFRRYRPIQSLFLVDVLRDRDSRPAFLWALSTLLVGTFFYHWAEGWSYLDSVYFCVVSLGTVGYGDLTPTTPIAKLFTIVYLINGIVILLAFFDRIRMVRTQRIERLAERRREK
jgi:voltage-gated potassium channel